MKKLTIAYFTNRLEPKFEWFIDSLLNQLGPEDDIELLFIDLQLEYQKEKRLNHLKSIVNGRIPYRHIPPKPCSWQGSHRKTKCDFFSASNTRNTAFIECNTSHIACVDDLSVLSPVWMNQVRHALEHHYVMCGSYKKADEMVVENGYLISHGKEYVDSRWNFGTDGIKPCSGDLLYGCSFVVPMDYVLRVNGFDEQCDGGGAEDYDFGIRLERAGAKIYYNRNALTTESNELHSQPPMMQRRKKKCITGEDSDWYMLNRLREQTKRFTTLFNYTDIAKVKEHGYQSMELPTHDWCDNQPLSEMGEEHGNETPKYDEQN